MIIVYTSITKSYLPKARVLAKSVKLHHPNWSFVLLYSDKLPLNFDLTEEPFNEVLTIDKLEISNWQSWAFGHSLVELCTAVKGPAAKVLARRPGVNKIIYLDPDIKVFNSLSPLDELLNKYEILLTPHLLEAEIDINAIADNEISALKHGIYNLGFFAANTSGQGFDFIQWWSKRLQLFCRDDIPSGLFTDQRWCDLAPAFFSKLHIVRDIGYNVATWNISHRTITKSENGEFLAGTVPLRFYHFTSYDNGAGKIMLSKYAKNQPAAYELWDNYSKELDSEGNGKELYSGWDYGKFENGIVIPNSARLLYRDRQDIQEIFPDPYSTIEPSFFSFYEKQLDTKPHKRLYHNFFLKKFVIKSIKKILNCIKHEGLLNFAIKIYKSFK